MKDLRWPAIDRYRIRSPEVMAYYGGFGGVGDGVFALQSPIDKGTLAVIVSTGYGWEHVSVSRTNRCPNWAELEFVKRLFFKDDETVMQLHVPPSDHVNNHEYCLHLWRPIKLEIPRPPAWMVGGTPPSDEELEQLEKETQ